MGLTVGVFAGVHVRAGVIAIGVGMAERGGIAVGRDVGVGVGAGTGVAVGVGSVIAEPVSVGVGVGVEPGPEHAANNTAAKAIVTNQRNSFPITK